VIRPVLEYCSVVWHHGLTKAQADSLEAIQRRALRITYPVIYDFPYDAALSIAQMASLFDLREQMNRHFFKSVLSQSSCIFSLLPQDPNLETSMSPLCYALNPHNSALQRAQNVTPHLDNTDYYTTKLYRLTTPVYSSTLCM